MIEEYSIQQTERTSHVSATLMSYINNEIARLNERLEKLRPYGKADVEAVFRMEIYQRIKAQLAQPNPQYDALATQLQTEYIQAEQEFTMAKQRILPFSQDLNQEAMPGDMYFLQLQQDIVREKGILAKAAAVLDADDKAYIVRKINHYKHEQSVRTDRGNALMRMESAHTRMNTIHGLQQYIPQPSAPAAK